MNRRIPAIVLPVALAVFGLTGCGGGDTPSETPAPSASNTSASPSPSKPAAATPSATTSNEPTVFPDPTESTAPAEAAPTQAPAAGVDEVQQFFQTGGQCISDVWSSSMPRTDALQQKVVDYCAANQLGDWAHGVDPMDPKNYGGQQDVPETSEAARAEEIAKCQALDMNTAMSGDIQYCYMEYGITPPGAPAYDPGATPDVAGPPAP